MSEYQYYEFCKINTPLTPEARKEMYSLSSRAKVTTHGASYVYNYGDFGGNPKQILLRHFDVFFYIANWGSLQLIFKYPTDDINVTALKQLCIDELISCEIIGSHMLLDIDYNNETGFSGWIEGEGILAELLPLYNEIKLGNYKILKILMTSQNNTDEALLKSTVNQCSGIALTEAQEAYLKYTELTQVVGDE